MQRTINPIPIVKRDRHAGRIIDLVFSRKLGRMGKDRIGQEEWQDGGRDFVQKPR